MGVARSLLICMVWATFALPCRTVQAQSAEQPSSKRVNPRTTDSGQANDGTPPYGMPQIESEGVLREMADRAAVIFSGTVTAVHKGKDEDLRSNAGAAIVEVDFAVEHAIKGAIEGSVYTMREWAGLWRDSPRFAIGQRLLMLLHSAGPGGLSSPVDGLNGAIPIKATDVPSTLAGRPTALAVAVGTDAPHDDAVDLRWLQVKTLRLQTFADEPAATPGEGFANILSVDVPLAGAAGVAQGVATHPATAAGLTHVLGLLMSWRENGNVSR